MVSLRLSGSLTPKKKRHLKLTPSYVSEEGSYPLLKQLPGMQEATVIHMDFMQLPELTVDGIYGEAAMDKQQWKNEVKENLKWILKQKPEAVYVEGNVFETYPIVHQLRKKHIPVLTMMEKDGQKLIIQIPSGS